MNNFSMEYEADVNGGVLDSASRAHVSVYRVQNGGFIVVVYRNMRKPDMMESYFKTIATIIPSIHKAGGQAQVRGIDEEIDPWKKGDADRGEKEKQEAAAMVASIQKAFGGDQKPPAEVFVFADKIEMLAFVDRIMSESPKPDPAPGKPT